MKSYVRNIEEGKLFMESFTKNIGLTKGHDSLRIFVKSWIEEDEALINILYFQLCAEFII